MNSFPMHSIILKKTILVIFLSINLLIWYAVSAEERNGLLTVAFLDVGQGDAIYIESPVGNQLLIDGGRNSQILHELGKVMPFYDRSIDIVVASHPDADHIGGLPKVLNTYEVGALFVSGVNSDSDIETEVKNVTEEKNIKIVKVDTGMVIDMKGGVTIEILFPQGDVSNFKTNNASVVAKLKYGEFEVILTGDAPQEIEKELVKMFGSELQSDILKVGHHGSRTSTSKEFIEKVSPQYAIVSASKDNSYGHPHQEVLSVLDEAGADVLCTCDKSTLIFISDGTNFKLK